MGVRGEIFSTRVILPNRTYFFNVKENRMGDLYLNIVESKNRDTGGFERQSVILFEEDLREFLKGFDDSLRILEKAIRERKRSGRSGERPPEFRERGERPAPSAPAGKQRRMVVKKSEAPGGREGGNSGLPDSRDPRGEDAGD
ncbi:MAG: DUF3276 family protein [Treponema sp.]|jgi:hypothetical protein|nr:DUF3276 family protein [Treponema sp.]